MTTTDVDLLPGATASDPAGRALSVSVVVCIYTDERWFDLGRAFASIGEQSVRPDELIIVVDHNPALAEQARHAYPGARVIENAYKRGLSGARNTGFEAACGDVVAFLDDDAVPDSDWLERLTVAYGRGVLGVGGVAEAAWPAYRPRWFPPEFDWVVGCTYRGLPEARAAVRNLIGANMSLRRDVLESVGGFHAGLGRVGAVPVGCEETDLCLRAAESFPDGRFVFEPRARVSHRVTTDRATLRYFVARCFAEGRSKAVVARRAGRRKGLASERSYTYRTLPRGITRGLADALTWRDPWGALRAATIAVGLGVTTTGYAAGRIRAVGR